MVFKKFRVQVIIRLAVIVACCGFLLYYIIVSEKYIRSFYLDVIAIIAVIELFYYIDRLNRDMANFFQSILSSDFTNVFNTKQKGKSFGHLYENMNRITKKFREISAEKEIQYLYLQTLVEQANVGLLSYTEEGEIRLANLAFRELLNVKPLPRDSSIRDLPGGIYDQIRGLIPGKRRLITLKIRDKMTPFVFTSTRVKTKKNDFILISVQNIRQELDEKELESWQKLIRVLTHEIMNSATPITSLSSSLFEMLQRSKNKPVTNKEIQRIVNGLEAIKDRSSGLMKFTRAYQSLTRIPKPQVRLIPIDELAHRLEILAKAHLEDKKIEFHIRVSEGVRNVQGDLNLLDQVFLNLLKNSIEALEGRQDPKIDIIFRMTDEGKTIIRLVDNGPGMMESIREQIFIPFFTTKDDGSGIGLSLCKQIIRLHGGWIAVESAEGKGTSIIIIL